VTTDTRVTADDAEWQEEIRDFLSENFTNAARAELRNTREGDMGPAMRHFWKRVGENGWFSLTWPVEYGGQGIDPVRRQILIDEFEYAGVPMMDMTVTCLAPVIMKHGTDLNRREWIPGIARGEVTFALGYSEPDAGTDLASLRTSARREGDQWVIDGEKTWNTGGHYQTHQWLAVRTGGPGYLGISIIIVPMSAPGVTVSPIWTWGDHRTNSVHFDGVRVPVGNLIGEMNQGWRYIAAALDNERGSLGSVGGIRRLLDELIEATRTTTRICRPLCEDPVVRQQIAELYSAVNAAHWLSYSVASHLEDGNYATVPSTILKVMVTELRTRISRTAMSILGLAGQLGTGDADAPAGGVFEQQYRVAPMFRFGGGTNEVMRDVIAQRGLKLPRTPRRKEAR
jgi:alkylation response protein AidB-like acyl-CoA dehydrogenase